MVQLPHQLQNLTAERQHSCCSLLSTLCSQSYVRQCKVDEIGLSCLTVVQSAHIYQVYHMSRKNVG